MKYLGFEIYRAPWQACRGDLILQARTLRDLKKYIRAIVASERTGVIR